MSALTQINLVHTLTLSLRFICGSHMASYLHVSHRELCMHLSSPQVFGMLSVSYHPVYDNPDNY